MFGSNTSGSFNFGGKPSSNNNANGGSGLFGNSNNNNNAAGPTSSGILGQSSNTGLFGNSKPLATGSTGLFGNSKPLTTGSTGLFGNSNTQSSQPQGSNLFGNSNSNNNQTGGLFGNTNTNNGSNLFGNNSANNNSKPTIGGGLFGNSNNSNVNTNTNNTSGGFNFANTNGSSILNNNNNNNNNNTLSSKVTATTVNIGDLMPSITEGPRQETKSSFMSIKRKRSSTLGSAQTPPYVNHNTIIKNLSTQLKMKNGNGTFGDEDVRGIFSPARNSIIDKFVPPSTTVGSLKSDKNFKQILASSKLTEIKKLINKKKYGARYALEDSVSEEPKRRKIVNGDVVDEPKEPEIKLLPHQSRDLFSLNKEEDLKTHLNENGNEKKEEQQQQQLLQLEKEHQVTSKTSKENKDGYWCVPTIEELSQLSYDHLSNVEDFIIGRVGFGQISFNYPVDLTFFKDSLANELFGKVVSIKEKVVRVYPSSYDKPEIGLGLNVPATITLENLAPVDPETNRPIVNPSHPEVKNHVKMLKSLKGMQFVSYDPIVGTWVFQVGHFSIWGLVDSANEEDMKAWEKTQKEEESLEKQRLKEQDTTKFNANNTVEELSKFHHPIESEKSVRNFGTRSLIEDTFVYKMQKNNDSQPTAVIPGGWSFAPVSASNADTSAASLMHKKSEFRPDTPEIESESNGDEENGEDGQQEEVLEPESPYFDESDIDVDIGSDIVDEKAYEPELDDIDVAALEISSKFETSKNWLEQLTLASDSKDSAFNYKNTSINYNQQKRQITISDVDQLLFKDFKDQIKENEEISKKFKLKGKIFASFTANGSILRKTPTLDHKNLTGVVEVNLQNQFQLDDLKLTQNSLNKLLSTATIVKRKNGFPKVLPNSELNFLVMVLAYNKKGASKDQEFWDLCSRFFDHSRVETSDGYLANAKLVELKRKELLAQWIKESTKEEINQLLMKNQLDPLESIFIYIVSNNLVRAAQIAIETNNNHLAVLISLLGSNDSHVKLSCENQINEWKRTNALKFIPKPLLKVYLLLAESPLIENDLRLDITEDLSWKSSFGLILNYSDKTVIDSIRELEKFPFDNKNDIFFNVLKLYSFLFEVGSYDLEEVLDKFNIGGLNFEKQWFLYEILVRSSGRIETNEGSQTGDVLCLAFAEQLKTQKLYLGALFVLSHLSDDVLVEKEFYQLVTRHISDLIPDLSDNSLKKTLIQTLHVSRLLVSELISLKYRYLEDHWKEVELLIDARFWKEAATSVVKNIAPSVIIGDNPPEITKLALLMDQIKLSQFEEISTGLGIYQSYIKLVQLYSINKNDRSIPGHLQFLLDNLPNLVTIDQSKFTKVASTLMSKKVGDIILELGDNFIQTDKILALPMGESELKYFEYKLLSKEYVDKDVILD